MPTKSVSSSPDRDARDQAANLLEAYLAATISNDELERRWPQRSSDPALEEIRRAVWLSYDDERTHNGPIAAQDLVRRCADFLRTNEPYAWPIPKLWQRLVTWPLTLGLIKSGPDFKEPWPFHQR